MKTIVKRNGQKCPASRHVRVPRGRKGLKRCPKCSRPVGGA
jgi:hypothetical protein